MAATAIASRGLATGGSHGKELHRVALGGCREAKGLTSRQTTADSFETEEGEQKFRDEDSASDSSDGDREWEMDLPPGWRFGPVIVRTAFDHKRLRDAMVAKEAAQEELDTLRRELVAARAELEASEWEFAAKSQELATVRAEAAESAAQRGRAHAELHAAQGEVRQCRKLLRDLGEECKCPISHNLMRDPVVTADGHSYERRAIARWLCDHNTSPMTGAQLACQEVLPNLVAGKVAQCLRSSGTFAEEDDPAEADDGLPPIEAGAFLEAAARGDRAACLGMLARGVPDINATREADTPSIMFASGKSLLRGCGMALHVAAAHGWPDVCKLVVATPGFDHLRVPVANGKRTALWYARTSHSEATVNILLQAGLHDE